MIVSKEQRELLKKHGFMWFKDKTTDRVEADYIEDILPAANGFTVVYKHSVIRYSTATVQEIELPQDLCDGWIRVHWIKIEDEHVGAEHG